MVPLDRSELRTGQRVEIWNGWLIVLLLLLIFFTSACTSPGTSRGPTSNVLNAVVALTSDNIWAVGGMSSSSHFGFDTLIEHWNGQHWQTVLPDIAGELCALSAFAANDIWAVGGDGFCRSGRQSLALHWDGQHWQSLSAGLRTGQGSLLSVLALSSHNVWAVGTDERQARIEHWDGTIWSNVPQPDTDLGSALQAIAGRSANDLWAVGHTDYHALAEHWDGKTWNVVPMPEGTQDKRLLGDPDFTGLAALPGGQLWAVGEIELSSVYQATPLIERWNGTRWEVVYGSAPQNPNLHTPGSAFQAIAVVNAHDAWAVGSAGNLAEKKTNTVLVYHWDGQNWHSVKAPSFFAGSQLNSISAFAADNIWAVGSSDVTFGTGESITLIEHWDGRSWQAVPSPNPGHPAPPMGKG